MSSAILYAAIIGIWAFALVPRWLRRTQHAAAETEEYAGYAQVDDPVEAPAVEATTAPRVQYQTPAGNPASGWPEAPLAGQDRARVLKARRRMLTMLAALAVAAAACTYLKLTSWWVFIPPVVMLGAYLLLLREAALADAEQGRWRAAEEVRVLAARQRSQPVVVTEEAAQVIDISARLSDQLYDQYADATVRAVGD
jgi:hypothetical protein